jgi:nitrogen fixation NifU-like protein
MVGRTVENALSTVDSFAEMIGSRGQIQPDEAVLADGVAFAGVSKYPARVKCALLSWMAFKEATVAALAAQGGAA